MRPSHPRSRPYAVVGGGVSGIAAAYYLRQQGLETELIEKDEGLGGRVGPGRLGDSPVDLGGKNIGRKYSHFREFASALGFEDYEPFGINTSRVREGRLRTLDSSRRWRGGLSMLRGLPASEMLRFASLCARVKLDESNRFLSSATFGALGQRSDAVPLTGHFSRAFCDGVLRPMTVRMNGAEPDEVYLGSLGTNLGMLMDTYDQLSCGMSPLLERFAATGPVRLGTRVESLLVRGRRITGLRLVTADGRHEEREYAGVVLATPAPVSSRLLAPFPELATGLETIRYFPVMVIVAEYEQNVFSPGVRAILFGPEEPLSNAGAYGIHALNLVRYTFSGRTARPLLYDGTPPERLLELAEERLGRHVPVRSARRRAFVARTFDPGLCAYAPNHGRLRATLRQELARVEGLALAGDYLEGTSIEACFRAARGSLSSLLSPSQRVAA